MCNCEVVLSSLELTCLKMSRVKLCLHLMVYSVTETADHCQGTLVIPHLSTKQCLTWDLQRSLRGLGWGLGELSLLPTCASPRQAAVFNWLPPERFSRNNIHP